MSIVPDTKDWTWVLEKPCPECGFDASTVVSEDLSGLIHENTTAWFSALDDPDAGVRPSPEVWSPLEYACHVRDVHLVFGERVRRMLEEDDPQFPNWDQDVTAIEERYAEQDPAQVSNELVEMAGEVAMRYAGVHGSQWERPGRRSNGSVFTVASIGRYHLHDVVHHLNDIGQA
jgi:predicted  nucleic acid-binding Zn-ribbon protein